MKRSNIIEELRQFFWNVDNDSFSPSCHDKNIKLLAEQTLNFIEKAGMLPPKTSVTDPGHFPSDRFEYTAYEWEPEDE